MNKQYYLSHSGTHIGPYNLETVLDKVTKAEHLWTDYVYDETVGEWLMLMEHPEFAAYCASNIPPVTQIKIEPPDESEMEALNSKDWFIMREGHKHGPHTRLEIVQMLQEKTLFEYSPIWTKKMQTWQPVAEVLEFSPSAIRELVGSRQ